MTDTCKSLEIKLNQANSDAKNAKQTLDTANSSYLTCLPATNRGAALTAAAAPEIARLEREAQTIDTTSLFILQQLQRETGANTSMNVLTNLAEETSARLESEIEELKTNIRTERRRFMDSDPSASTSIAGLYFTQQPDNQMIIIFLLCFGIFLLVSGLAIMYGFVTVGYLNNASMSMRYSVVMTYWVSAVVVTVIGFFTFT
jgi:hypothetical protein